MRPAFLVPWFGLVASSSVLLERSGQLPGPEAVAKVTIDAPPKNADKSLQHVVPSASTDAARLIANRRDQQAGEGQQAKHKDTPAPTPVSAQAAASTTPSAAPAQAAAAPAVPPEEMEDAVRNERKKRLKALRDDLADGVISQATYNRLTEKIYGIESEKDGN